MQRAFTYHMIETQIMTADTDDVRYGTGAWTH